jgi:hypothetical protein
VTFCASGIAHKFLTARGLALGPPAGIGEMIVGGKLRAEKDGCKPGENTKENQRDRPGENFLAGRRCDKRSPSLLFLEAARIVRMNRCFQSWLDGLPDISIKLFLKTLLSFHRREFFSVAVFRFLFFPASTTTTRS